MSRGTAAIPVIAVGAAAAVLSGGCSAGQLAQTAEQAATIPGVNQTIEMRDGDQLVGQLALRNLTVHYQGKGYPVGGNAPLNVRISNSWFNPVQLCTVLSDAGEVTKSSGPIAPAAPQTPTTPATTPDATPTGAPDAAGAPATTAPAATTTAAPPAATQNPTTPAAAPTSTASPDTGNGCPLNISIPASSSISLVPGAAQYLQIQRLQQPIMPGTQVALVFVFTDSQGKQWRTAPFQVPMNTPNTPLPRASSDIEEGEH